jgi:hypothetical protein
MRKVQVYIEGQRLELFEDEQIQITSSVQNVQDIAKVFTDFSQSFTVPASEHNNQIFQHFYETDVDSTLDHQLRRNAKIEIDLVTFRTGKIQLEKANLKKGRVENYSVTFYGDVRTLQDYFGDDKLAVLDFSPYEHTYSGSEIQARITDTTDYDIRYPLISSERVWSYNDSTSTDITKTSTRMNFQELFPALKVRRVFDAIETYYGVDFQGVFLTDQRFDKAFFYLKNSEDFTIMSPVYDIDLYYTDNSSVFNLTNDSLTLSYLAIPQATHKVEIKVTPAGGSFYGGNYYVDVYRNNTLYTTITGNNLDTKLVIEVEDSVGLNDVFTFKIKGDATFDYQFFVYYSIITSAGTVTSYANTYIFGGQIVADNLNLSDNIPDMTVSDFVKGVLKEFNLTIAPITQTSFELMPLEDWYSKGRIIDITKHTDIDSIDIQRVPLYKRISFKYQQSESFMNGQFSDTFGREYGSLEQTYDYDGAEYLVESPFENLLHNKFTGTDLQVGYCINRNWGKYIPKPMLLYMAEQKTCNFKFNNGSSVATLTNYIPFGQDTYANGQYYSLNFGPEISSLRDIVINNHIFNTYYSNYINNLYVKKNRLVYVKCYLPLSILASIRLNDRVVIRDKRYVINEMSSNLTTGEVNLVLLLDFRRFIRKKPKFIIDKTGGIFKSPVILPNKCVQADIDVGTTGITATPNRIFVDTNVEFNIPSNPDPAYYLITEDSYRLDTEDFFDLRSEEGTFDVLTIVITYTYEDGTTEKEDYPFILSDL